MSDVGVNGVLCFVMLCELSTSLGSAIVSGIVCGPRYHWDCAGFDSGLGLCYVWFPSKQA